jgi:hypothetical protein
VSDRVQCTLGIVSAKREIGYGLGRFPYVAVTGIARQTYDPHGDSARVGPIERLADGILSVEKCFDECLIDDDGAGIDIVGAEIAAVEEWDLHRLQPARRNVQQET